jgi:hypothetical protein
MKVLTPGVQNGGDANVGSEVFAIGSNDGEGLGGSLQQQAINYRLVLIGDPAQRSRHPENHVEIRHRQELGFARREPCSCRLPLAFGAVPVTTAVVGDPRMLTFLTTLDMTAELGSSSNLDCLHDASLRPVDVAGIGSAPRLTMAAEDVRYFQLRSEHVRPLPCPPPSAGPAGAELRGRPQTTGPS